MLPAGLVLATSLAACGSGTGDEPGSVKIAFVEDLSSPDALEHILPARRSVELALQIAEITGPSGVKAELVPLDVAADPEALDRVESDPAFVAVIVAPGATLGDVDREPEPPHHQPVGSGWPAGGRCVAPPGGAVRGGGAGDRRPRAELDLCPVGRAMERRPRRTPE